MIFGVSNYDENDFDFTIESFPSIWIYKIGKKNYPIEYDGMRDYEVILDFL